MKVYLLQAYREDKCGDNGIDVTVGVYATEELANKARLAILDTYLESRRSFFADYYSIQEEEVLTTA